MTIKWATKLRKGTRKKDRNKFVEKGFGSSAQQVLKNKNEIDSFTSQKYFPFPIPFRFYANLWKTSPTNKIL